jgi:glycosyltransferase involved in cell wall biosynthesis
MGRGRRFDFAYAWSPTIPTLMIRRNLLRPWIDAAFFRWCRRQEIPIGLFYGDVHYRLDHFRANVPWADRGLMQLLYRLDWLVYRRFVDHLFLPSLRMAPYLPTRWPTARMSALLPGCRPAGAHHARTGERALQLFYVGGITPPLYDLKPMVDTVAQLPGVHLTLCCREGEWAKAKTYYGSPDPGRIRVVHASGEELELYYEAANVFCMFWRHPYLEITMPVKVFEALGHSLPLIAAAGTEAGRFTSEAGVGWTPGSGEEFRQLLVRLRDDREEIFEKQRQAAAVRYQHTWQIRARQVASTLIGCRAAPERGDPCRG